MAERATIIALGMHVAYDAKTWTVVALHGSTATLQSWADGQLSAVLVTHLVAADDFQVMDRPRPAPVSADSLLEGLPAAELERARRLEAHLIRLDPAVPAGDVPPPQGEGDQPFRGVEERVAAKVAS